MNDKNKQTETGFDDVPEWAREPHPRDILKREYEEAQKRPRDIALEKWRPELDGMIERDMARRMRLQKTLPQSFVSPTPPTSPKKDEPDMDR